MSPRTCPSRIFPKPRAPRSPCRFQPYSFAPRRGPRRGRRSPGAGGPSRRAGRAPRRRARGTSAPRPARGRTITRRTLLFACGFFARLMETLEPDGSKTAAPEATRIAQARAFGRMSLKRGLTPRDAINCRATVKKSSAPKSCQLADCKDTSKRNDCNMQSFEDPSVR